MSDTLTVLKHSAPEHSPKPALPVTPQIRGRLRTLILKWLSVAALAGAVYWGFLRFKQWNARNADEIPTAKVERADVSFTITGKGELRGGNPEPLIAPETGGADLHIT